MGLLIVGGSASPGPPPPPPALPGVGKDGLGHRWHASRATTSGGGTTVLSWPDAILTSTDNLVRTVFEAGSPEPQLMSDPTPQIQYVRIAGIDLAGSQQLAPPRSFFVVFRSTVLNTQIVKIAGCTIIRAGNSKVKVSFGSGVSAFGTLTSPDWHSVIVNADTAGGTCTIDGVYQTVGTYTPGPAGGMYTVHQMGDGSGTGTKVADIADHGTWASGLSSDDQAAVYAALKAAYPVIP